MKTDLSLRGEGAGSSAGIRAWIVATLFWAQSEIQNTSPAFGQGLQTNSQFLNEPGPDLVQGWEVVGAGESVG